MFSLVHKEASAWKYFAWYDALANCHCRRR